MWSTQWKLLNEVNLLSKFDVSSFSHDWIYIDFQTGHFADFKQQPSQLLMAKGNCLQYCHQRENHRQQIFAVDHLFTISYEPFSILLNKIFSFTQMFIFYENIPLLIILP